MIWQLKDATAGMAVAYRGSGFAYTSIGEIYAEDLGTSNVPAGVIRADGMAFALDGRLYVTTQAPTTTDNRGGGWVIRSDGALRVTTDAIQATDSIGGGIARALNGALRVSFGGSVFSPANLANLAAWYRFNQGITGALIASQWDDASGNARHLLQATGANQPIYLPYTAEKYGWLPGVSGNYFSTPDAASLDITGDIDIRVRVAMDDWTPAATRQLIGKDTGAHPNRSYGLRLQTDGTLLFTWSADGAALITKASTVATGISDGAVKWVRVTLDVDNNAAGNTVTFFTSDDGSAWTQLGSPVVTAATTSIIAGSAALNVGVLTSSQNLSIGKFYRAQVYNGIAGTLVADFDPSLWTSGTTFIGGVGNVWTINSTGSKPAQIVNATSILGDGVSDFLKAAAFTLVQPWSLVLFERLITWTLGDYLCDGEAAGSGAVYQSATTPRLRQNAGSDGTENAGLALNTYGMLVAVFDGANSFLQINDNAPVVSDPGAGNPGGFTLGAKADGSVPANFQIKEAILTSGALTAGEIVQLYAYGQANGFV